MRFLDLTLPTPVANLALDEALLDEAEAADRPTETLRLWEPLAPMVVVGRSSEIAAEVHEEACRRRGIPVLRRASGGAAVVIGPGCLMYALVLSLELRPVLRAVDAAHRLVLGVLARALSLPPLRVVCRGTSDLTIEEGKEEGKGVRDLLCAAPSGSSGQKVPDTFSRKFSGNSIRMKRRHLLYHGTLLYDFSLELIGQCLARPPREPEYRGGRPHEAFVTNLPLARTVIREALVSAWDAREPCDDWPSERTAALERTKDELEPAQE